MPDKADQLESGKAKFPKVKYAADNETESGVHRLTVNEDAPSNWDDSWKALGRSMGIEDPELMSALLGSLSCFSGGGEAALNLMITTVQAIAPKDQAESIMAGQMAMTHSLLLLYANRLSSAKDVKEIDLYERIFNKLARTYAAQQETIVKGRNRGQQKVVVEQHHHYHHHQELHLPDGRGVGENERQPHEHNATPERETVRGEIKADRRALPESGIGGGECVPFPRGEGRRAQGGE